MPPYPKHLPTQKRVLECSSCSKVLKRPPGVAHDVLLQRHLASGCVEGVRKPKPNKLACSAAGCRGSEFVKVRRERISSTGKRKRNTILLYPYLMCVYSSRARVGSWTAAALKRIYFFLRLPSLHYEEGQTTANSPTCWIGWEVWTNFLHSGLRQQCFMFLLCT